MKEKQNVVDLKTEHSSEDPADRLPELRGLQAEETQQPGNLSVGDIEVLLDELRDRRTELENARRRYSQLYESVPVGYFTLDSEGLIKDVNMTGALLLGTEKEYLIECPFDRSVAEEDRNLFYSYRSRLLINSIRQSCELKMLREDGTQIYGRLEGMSVFDEKENQRRITIAVVDVTERKRTEKALRKKAEKLSKKNRYEEIVSSVTRSVHQSIELQEVLENAVQAMSDNVENADNVSIYFIEGTEAVIKAYRGYSEKFIRTAGRIEYPRGFTWRAMIEGKPMYCADTDEDTVIGPAGREMGTKSYASMPIFSEGEVAGVLDINSFGKNAFDQDELKLLGIVARQIETAINNARQAEHLRKSEEKFRNLVENTNDWIWEVDKHGVFTYVSPRVLDIIGFSPEEVTGNTPLDFMDSKESEQFSRILGSFIAERKPYTNLKKTLIHKSGREVILETSGSPMFDGEGAFRGYRGITRDITERKRAEEELRRAKDELEERVKERTKELAEINEELKKEIKDRKRAEGALRENLAQLAKKSRYETIIRTVTQSVHQSIKLQDVLENAVQAMSENIDQADALAVYLVEDKTAVLKASKGLSTQFIENASKISYPRGFAWKTIVEGEPRYCADLDDDNVIGTHGRQMGIKSYLSMPIHFQGKAVGCININSFQKRAFDEDELKLLGIVAQQIETAISNAKQAEALRESEERYRALYEDNPSMYFTVDEAGTVLSVNSFGAEHLGYTRPEIVGKPILDFFYEEDRAEVRQNLKKCLDNPMRIVRWKYRKVRKDYSVMWVREAARAVRDMDGNTVVLIVCEDITRRKQMEEALQSSEKRFRQLAENINQVFWITNAEGDELIYVSPAYENIWGRSCESLYKNPESWLNAIHPDDRAQVMRSFLTDAARGEFDEQYRIVKPYGAVSWIRDRGFPIRNEAGEVYRIAGIAEDITDKKLADEKIKKSLKEKEVLLKEIHHRVKNNLQIISSLLDLQSEYIHSEQARRKFKQSQNRLKSMALIHEKLYESEDLSRVDFKEYIENLSAYLLRSYRGGTNGIVLDVNVQNISLSIDKAIPCGLIINELISNSLKHAFPDRKRGEIRVVLYSRSGGSSSSRRYFLSVCDDGNNFPLHIDFRNTKSLGLQLVCALTDQLGGEIELDRSRGTEFKISFPP